MSNPVGETVRMKTEEPFTVVGQPNATPTPNEPPIRWSLSHALRLKAAEYWLQMGEPNQALQELDRLPKTTWGDPRVIKARLAAVGILRKMNALP